MGMFVLSFSPFGYDGILIRVEADIRRGIPGIDITGLAAGAVREARERVRVAFRNSGFDFPNDRILINLAPAGIRKDGAALDLPIALAVMAACGIAPPALNTMVLGELELSGRIRPVRAVLAATAAGLEAGIRDFIVPAENYAEAAILAKGNIAGVSTLEETVQVLQRRAETGHFYDNNTCDSAFTSQNEVENNPQTCGDFKEVRGQGRYKRILEIAAAGAHNLLVFGPPGAGKTMLAQRLPSIMAPLSPHEQVVVTRLHSLGNLQPTRLITQPPFRSPHHTSSVEGLVGGGKTVRPGEISLAHKGVLFLDEAPQFHLNVLQGLREPLEERVITITRAETVVRLPADFQLLLAANPCPCGRLGQKKSTHSGDGGYKSDASCFCSGDEIYRYWRRFGGALLDRIELRAAVNIPSGDVLLGDTEEPSSVIAKRVLNAVKIQRGRFETSACISRNAGMSAAMVEEFCKLTPSGKKAMSTCIEKLCLSGRAYHGVLRVARTIADLEGKDIIEEAHILEAVQHRRQGDDPYDVFSV
ncbi:Mg chelatase [Spirochaetia bacterium]|nr:Mg chelatase [Spirochaetia bacterium]